MVASTIPDGVDSILNVDGDVSKVVQVVYQFGDGIVFYSTMPNEHYVGDRFGTFAKNLREIYLPNELQAILDGYEGAPLHVLRVSPDPRDAPVETIDIAFDEPIAQSTFTLDDVTLTRDGGANLISAAVTLTRVDDTHYRIGGLESVTDDLGEYQITVDGNTITKAGGGNVGAVATDRWRRKDPPRIVDIIDVSPDPRETGVSTIDVTFSEPIQLSSFNRWDLRLTRDGSGPNLITDAVRISLVSGSTYRISNLYPLTETPGTYRLAVSGEFTDLFNITGTSTADEIWINNLAPKLVLGGSTTFVEHGQGVVLAAGAVASDPDDTVLAWGELNVAITANAASGDRLRIKSQGTGPGQITFATNRQVSYEGVVIGHFSGGVAADPFIVSLNASASLPAVQALVRSVQFVNVDSNPPTALRTVQFLLDDGDSGISEPQYKYVNIQRNGGLPQITMGGQPAYRENDAPLVLSPFAGFADADSPNFDGGKLTVAIVQNADAADRLSVQDQGTDAGEIGLSGSDVTFGSVVIGTLSGGVGATPLEISLNVNATRAAVRALIRNVTFATLGNRPDTAVRSLSFVLDDGDGGINSPVLKNVVVLAVNDEAVITADAGPVGYVNNAAAGVLIAPTATVADPDGISFNGGQLTVAVVRGAVAANRLEIGGGFTLWQGNVMLGTTAIGKLARSGVGFESLVINFTTHATRGIVEQLVRSIRFRSVNAAHAFDRSIAITVLDTPHGFGSTAIVNVAVRSS
jgi:hypothetical protein